MIQRLTIVFIVFLGLLVSGSVGSFAQTPTDPNLPESPLPDERSLFTPADETYQPAPVVPLLPGQKFQIAVRKTFHPSILVKSAIFTGFDRAIGSGPDYGEGWESIGKLYGYNAANIASSYLITGGVLPIVFHQDPRYFRKGSGPVKARILWALRSEVVSYSDNGTLMPNYSKIVGFVMSSALSNAYLPSDEVSFRNTMSRYALKFAVSSGFSVLRKFGGIKGILRRHKEPE